jgi:hypothetical protein
MLRALVPPRSLSPIKLRAVVRGVSAGWMRENFGVPHHRDDDLVAVLAPTDYWSFSVDDRLVAVLGHMPEYELLGVESDVDDAELLVGVLGLAGFDWSPVGWRPSANS